MDRKKEKISKDSLTLNHQASDSFHFLLDTIEGINRAMEFKSLLYESIETICTVMNAEASSLMLLDKDTGELFVSLPTGPVKEEIKGKSIPKHKGVGGWVIKHKEPFLSNNPDENDIFWGDLTDDFVTRNIICVPLLDNSDRPIGVIQAINRKDGKDFQSHDIPVFEALANHVTIAIERTRKLENMHDGLKAKEVMLTEIHHRIKNNLATISSLIEIEIPEVEDQDAKQILKNTYSRIQSVTEVHDLLCNNNFLEDIDLGIYLEQLADKISDVLSTDETNMAIHIKAESVQIGSERAMLCGLVLNELIINCYKHAFRDMEKGEITISLGLVGDKNIRLEVSDNGVGVDENFTLEETQSIGTWVINVLLRRLEADVSIERLKGTRFVITFEK